MADPGASPPSDPNTIAPDEGDAGISPNQDEEPAPLDDLDDPDPPDAEEEDEEHAAREVRVCRNLSNTVDNRPGGRGWFSA